MTFWKVELEEELEKEIHDAQIRDIVDNKLTPEISKSEALNIVDNSLRQDRYLLEDRENFLTDENDDTQGQYSEFLKKYREALAINDYKRKLLKARIQAISIPPPPRISSS